MSRHRKRHIYLVFGGRGRKHSPHLDATNQNFGLSSAPFKTRCVYDGDR